jgi:hypothetical protein
MVDKRNKVMKKQNGAKIKMKSSIHIKRLLYYTTCLFTLVSIAMPATAGGKGSISSLRPYAKFLSFLKRSEPREVEEIEGAWVLKNIDEIKLRSDLDNDPLYGQPRWNMQLQSLKHTINSVQVRCIRSAGKCYEAIASVNTDEIENSKAPPGLEAQINIWEIKDYNANQLIATYYDGCYNYTVTIDINQETALKVGVAIENSPCHRGFTNKTVVYELKGGKSAFNYMFNF